VKLQVAIHPSDAQPKKGRANNETNRPTPQSSTKQQFQVQLDTVQANNRGW
jgi:hypothetical protein